MAERVAVTVTLDAPIERVWEKIMDPHRLGEWVTIHDRVSEVPEGGLQQGSRFKQRMKRLRFSFEVEWEVVELERPRLARWHGSGPAGSAAAIVYELSETDGGKTKFHYVNEFDLPGGGAGKLAAKALGSAAARREAKKSLERLRKLLDDESD